MGKQQEISLATNKLYYRSLDAHRLTLLATGNALDCLSQLKSIAIDYHRGLRYPSLQRVEGTPDRLDDILAPSKSPLPSE